MSEQIFFLIVLFFSITIHEIAHGSVALSLGDPTAKWAGRLTLNPLKHIDFFGTILLPIFLFITTNGQGPIFGWAKPVPVNPFNFRDQKWGNLKVAIAGPLVNLFIAVVFGLAIKYLPLPILMAKFFTVVSFYNLALAIFNLIPLPPLDGSHILFSFLPEFSRFKIFLQKYGIFILIFFIFFGINLVFNLAYLLFNILVGGNFVI